MPLPQKHVNLKLKQLIPNILAILCFIPFAYIAVQSIFQTSVIDPEKYSAEHILFPADDWIVNLVMLFIFYVAVYHLNKAYSFFAKVNMKVMYGGMVVYVLAIGLYWVFSVWQIPGADSANIFETATEVIAGDYSSFYNGSAFYNASFFGGISYYNFCPYQLGFVFICEIVYRLFGTDSAMPVQVLNVICVALTYCGVARISRLMFKRKSIEFFTIMLLACFLQPMLFSSFPYGNIVGMACAVWASYFLIKYLQTSHYKHLIPCTVLLAVAILAKYNNLIYMVAFVIILLLHTISIRNYKSLIFAIVMLFVSVTITDVIVMSYEARAGVTLAKGQPQMSYLAMGLNKSSMAPGWYSSKYKNFYRDNNCDTELTISLVKEDMAQNIEALTSDKAYAREFFSQKILSQWNEPTFQSIWVSKTKHHVKEPTEFAKNIYDGTAGRLYDAYCNQYIQSLYLLFSAGLLTLILKRKMNLETVLLPLILLGGFGYHLLFEAKAQYALTYIVLLTPTAAYAVQTLLCDTCGKVKAFFDEK